MLQYRRTAVRFAILILTFVTVGVSCMFAQDVQMVPDRQDRESAEKAQRTNEEEDKPVATFRARTDVVQFLFNVKDKKGGLIAALTKDDFQVLENQKPQTIKYFAANSDLPLTLGILIDTSASQQNVIGMEQEVGGAFLSDIMTSKDQAFVIDFGIGVSLIQDFTNSTRRLKEALNSVKVNSGGQGALPGTPGMGGGPVPTVGQPKGTLLYDAVFLTSHDQMGPQVDRKAMILLTDGEDQGSQYKIRDAIEAAQKADTIVYVLLCADRGFYGGFGYSGDSEMKKLTEETGGRVIEVGNKVDKLRAAFKQISDELRSQYSIGYVPLDTKRDGGFRRVEIKTKQGYKVQARSGYFAMPEEQ